MLESSFEQFLGKPDSLLNRSVIEELVAERENGEMFWLKVWLRVAAWFQGIVLKVNIKFP